MIRLAALFLAGLALAVDSHASPAHSLTVSESFTDPIGFYDSTPTFSWKLPRRTAKQSAYRVEVTSDELLWDSGWVESDQSVLVPYEGEPLTSRQQVVWRVNFRDGAGQPAGWSEPATIEMGLLSSRDWAASWIRPAAEIDTAQERVAWLRKGFGVSKPVRRARLYVTARGVFQASLNGTQVGSEVLAPGWTSYSKRIDTLTYDVTNLLERGHNAIGVALGTGWYAGRLGWKHDKGLFGRFPEALVQLEIVYQDGSKQSVLSDNEWKATHDGPIRSASLYDGEHYDARKAMPGWDRAGFDDTRWDPVIAEMELGEARLAPKPFGTSVVTETVPTVSVAEPAPGHFVFDLGQNLVGWMALEMPGVAGEPIQVRCAEMLNPDGTIYTDNYRTAKSTNVYTPAETGVFRWKPTFTFHGFRYLELTGVPEGTTPDPSWVTGLVVHTRMPKIGSFRSSDELLNRLQANISWGQRGNFLDVPTDCPQRDERLGWTGDAQAFCSTALFNYDCHAFFKSWLGSMRDDQLADGQIPHVIPDVLRGKAGSPGWMDAATIVPWDVYVRTGDREILADNYAMMTALVDWYRARAKDGVVRQIGGFGDWLQPYSEDRRGETPKPLLGSAFFAKSLQILADSAAVLGKPEHAALQHEAEAVRRAFADHFFDGRGRLKGPNATQTGYVLALEFGLVPEPLRAAAAGELVRLIEDADGHLRTGFLGTPYLTRVLDNTGHTDTAFSLLFNPTYPSWFFSIHQGATTMWERWDSYTHADGFHPQSMNSFNHYAYGAVGSWMYERVAGLAVDPARPGYKHFYIRPAIGGPLTSAHADLETPYGRAASGWSLDGDTLTMQVEVPPNTTATVEFPTDRQREVLAAGRHEFVLTVGEPAR